LEMRQHSLPDGEIVGGGEVSGLSYAYTRNSAFSA
jgi:hypothetical protein